MTTPYFLAPEDLVRFFSEGEENITGRFSFLGPQYYADTSFLDIAANTWTPGPTLSYKRHGHSCNLVTQQSGDKEIVIVGGIDPARDQDCQVQREVEILNLDTMTVRNGEEMLLKH